MDLYVFPSYCTAALCPLDQTPHSVMAARWAQTKAHLSRAGRDMNVFMAISLIRRIAEEALSEKNQRAGWSRCGFTPGEVVQRNIVLKERFEELFSSKKAGAGDLAAPQTATSNALGLLETVSSKKTQCSYPGCVGKVSPADRFCATCSQPNPKFDESIAEMAKPKRSGWYKAPSQPAVVAENEEEEKLERGMGDLLSKIRKQNQTSEAGPIEKKIPPVEAPSSSSGQQKALPEPEVCALEEFDLENPEHCVEWILSCFSEKKRNEIKDLAVFYVSQLKSSTPKQPLSEAFYLKVIEPRLLSSNDGREKWLKATSFNRSKRFVGRPHEVWAKKKQ